MPPKKETSSGAGRRNKSPGEPPRSPRGPRRRGKKKPDVDPDDPDDPIEQTAVGSPRPRRVETPTRNAAANGDETPEEIGRPKPNKRGPRKRKNPDPEDDPDPVREGVLGSPQLAKALAEDETLQEIVLETVRESQRRSQRRSQQESERKSGAPAAVEETSAAPVGPERQQSEQESSATGRGATKRSAEKTTSNKGAEKVEKPSDEKEQDVQQDLVFRLLADPRVQKVILQQSKVNLPSSPSPPRPNARPRHKTIVLIHPHQKFQNPPQPPPSPASP